jgi:hypothetical protein
MAHACPVCGGEVALTIGEVFTRCSFCRASIVASSDTLIRRYLVRQHLSADAAEGALRRWMQGNEPVRGLPGGAELDKPSLEWLPVWYARVRGDKGARTEEHRGDDERVLEVRRRLIPPASLERLREDADPSKLPAPSVPVEKFKQKLPAGAVDELALVHVPYWRFLYRYGGARYSAAVDAATGEVRPGLYPKKPELPFRMLTGVTLGAYLAANAAYGAVFAFDWELPQPLYAAYPVTFGVSAFLALVLSALL